LFLSFFFQTGMTSLKPRSEIPVIMVLCLQWTVLRFRMLSYNSSQRTDLTSKSRGPLLVYFRAEPLGGGVWTCQIVKYYIWVWCCVWQSVYTYFCELSTEYEVGSSQDMA
jgi:hypothetical protein